MKARAVSYTHLEEARRMLGRTPGNIAAIRPLKQGVISDYELTEKMIKYFIDKSFVKKSLVKPTVSVCIPSGVTEVEKRAVEDAVRHAGARNVVLIEEPVAAAIGAGIDISRPCGSMIDVYKRQIFMFAPDLYFTIVLSGVILSFINMIFVAAKTVIYINYQGNSTAVKNINSK